MRQIIGGRIYDTEKSEKVACGDNGLSYGDCHLLVEELYLTPKGNYFICDAASNLIPVLSNFVMVIVWIEEWGVTNLGEREIKAFGIVEA